MAEYEGVTSDSPPDSAVQGGAPSAETLNTGQPAPPAAEPTVPYSRFHQVNTGFRQAEARAAAAEQAAALHYQSLQQLQQRQAQLESQLQQRVNQPSRTPDEEKVRQQAVAALRDLRSDDPEWGRVQRAAEVTPHLAQQWQQLTHEVAQMRDQQLQMRGHTEATNLYQMATGAGMSFRSATDFNEFNDYVAGVIARYPQALQAFIDGDQRVVPLAFQQARRELAGYEQRARANLNTSKTALSRVPPPIRGSTPGAPPPPQYDPKDPRGSMARVHAAAAEAFADRRAG